MALSLNSICATYFNMSRAKYMTISGAESCLLEAHGKWRNATHCHGFQGMAGRPLKAYERSNRALSREKVPNSNLGDKY